VIALATASNALRLVTLEEYLASSYEPDLEYVDGVLEEKNMGGWDHSFLQIAIGAWFFNHRAEWKIEVLSEYRTRTSQTRVRLPDLCIVRLGAPVERVRVTAPLICIEILSPEDRPGRVMKRLKEFVAMGAENIWVIDPVDRSASTFSRFGLQVAETDRLEVPGTPIYLDVPAIFATLDEGR
jgi:Uma2 family endonuclease